MAFPIAGASFSCLGMRPAQVAFATPCRSCCARNMLTTDSLKSSCQVPPYGALVVLSSATDLFLFPTRKTPGTSSEAWGRFSRISLSRTSQPLLGLATGPSLPHVRYYSGTIRDDPRPRPILENAVFQDLKRDGPKPHKEDSDRSGRSILTTSSERNCISSVSLCTTSDLPARVTRLTGSVSVRSVVPS
jgi:hypothetical protein